jgi:hypothetical protein
MLNQVQWGGSERALDVGTGRGLAAVSDFRHMGEYLVAFKKAGLDARKMPVTFDTFPPMRILTAKKLKS